MKPGQLPFRRCPTLLMAACAVCAQLACADAAFCEPSQLIRNLRQGESQRVVTYGTSLTRSEWPNQLAAWLDVKFPGQAEVINRGVPGMSSESTAPFFSALARL